VPAAETAGPPEALCKELAQYHLHQIRPKVSHRLVQIQAEETVQDVDTGKSGLLGPPRNIPPHEPSIFLSFFLFLKILFFNLF